MTKKSRKELIETRNRKADELIRLQKEQSNKNVDVDSAKELYKRGFSLLRNKRKKEAKMKISQRKNTQTKEARKKDAWRRMPGTYSELKNHFTSGGGISPKKRDK